MYSLTFCVRVATPRSMGCMWSCGIVVTRLCVPVCLSVRGRVPTLLHGPGCNLGEWKGMPPSCALLGRFAIGARVALLRQH